MKLNLQLTKSESDFFDFKIASLGLERYCFELWRKWGIRLMNQNEMIKEIYSYLRIRIKNKHLLIHKHIQLNSFSYELFRSIAIYLEIEVYQLISFLIYKDMTGDKGYNEHLLFNSKVA